MSQARVPVVLLLWLEKEIVSLWLRGIQFKYRNEPASNGRKEVVIFEEEPSFPGCKQFSRFLVDGEKSAFTKSWNNSCKSNPIFLCATLNPSQPIPNATKKNGPVTFMYMTAKIHKITEIKFKCWVLQLCTIINVIVIGLKNSLHLSP